MTNRLMRALVLATALIAPAHVHAADVTLAWDSNLEADVAGYVVYSGTTPGVYPTRKDVGNATTYVFTGGVPGTTYYFAVTAYASDKTESAKSEMRSAVVPGTPVLQNPGNRTNTTGDSVTLQLVATVAGNQPITYDATHLPFGLQLDPATGVISGTLSESSAGTYQPTVRATNTLDTTQSAAQTFMWTVNRPVDRIAPLVMFASSPQATASMFVRLAGTATDDVGVEQVQWSSDRGAAGGVEGLSNWWMDVTLQPGVNVITVVATDAAQNRGLATVMVTYFPPPTVSIAVAGSGMAANLSGTASAAAGIVKVSWANDRGETGVAKGTDEWSIGVQSSATVIEDAFSGTGIVDLASTAAATGHQWLEARDTSNANYIVRYGSYGRIQPALTDNSGAGILLYTARPSTPITGTKYDVAATLVHETGDADDATALIFGYRDPDNYCGLVWYGSRATRDLVLFRRAGGVASDLAGTDANPEVGSRMTVEVRGASIQVTRDAMPVLSATDSFCSEANGVGVAFGALRGVAGDDIVTKTKLDDFKVVDHEAVSGGVPLHPGLNTITVTAVDTLGSTGQSVVTVNRPIED